MNRIFKIGNDRILDDASTQHLGVEEVRDRLKHSYPEVAHATIRETESDGVRMVEFLPQAGRKG